MRVCLSNPRWRDGAKKGIRAACRVPNMAGANELTFMPFPFWLAYAAAVLERDGHDVIVVDAIGEDMEEDEYYRRVVSFKPDLIVNEMAAGSYDIDLQIAAKLKEMTGAPIAMCGPHPTAIPKEVLGNKCVDYVLLGEMEQTLQELVKALRDGTSVEGMDGLAWRGADGAPVVGKRRALLEDLDTLPYPHRETLPLKNYRVGGYPTPTMYMYATRGCPYKCTFCLWPQTMYKLGSYRMRHPRAVLDEVEYVEKRWGPFKSIYFDDDTFNLGHARMIAFADDLKKRPWRIPFGCNARTDHFTDEMMERLADVGLFNIRVGVESGDPEVLKRTKKDLDLATVPRCIEMAHRHGVKVHVTFTIGLSGESQESIQKTIDFAKTITPDSVAFTITTPFPGTAYYDEVVKNGFLVNKNWNDFNVIKSSVVRTETMTADQVTAAEKQVMRKVYFSPSYLIRRFRYAMNLRELTALARKGSKLLVGRY